MYTDIIKILTFVLQVLKENNKEAFKGSDIYDIYRQFYKVYLAGNRILNGRLMWNLESINSDTSFGSAEKKWLYFNNRIIRDYEDAKHELLIMFGPLESEEANQKYSNVFENNFLSKSLNGKTNEYSTVAHIDEDFQLITYSFNFVTNAKDVKPLRYFDTLFSEIKFDLSSEVKREAFIEESKPQIVVIYNLLKEYESIIAKYYSISDLFLHDKHFKGIQ